MVKDARHRGGGGEGSLLSWLICPFLCRTPGRLQRRATECPKCAQHVRANRGCYRAQNNNLALHCLECGSPALLQKLQAAIKHQLGSGQGDVSDLRLEALKLRGN